MRELGQVLRTQREELGLELNELESRTKIRKRYLIALEEGDWTILPGEVYARGFVRSYADALGLDGRDLLQRYGTDAAPMRDVDSVASVRSIVVPEPIPPAVRVERVEQADGDDAPHGSGELTPVESLTPQSASGMPSDVPFRLSSVQSSERRKPMATVAPGNRDGRRPETLVRETRPGRRRRANSGGQIAIVGGILAVLAGGLWLLESRGHNQAVTPPGSNASNVTSPAGGNGNVAGLGSGNHANAGSQTPGNAVAGNTVTGNTKGTSNATTPGNTTKSRTKLVAQPMQGAQQTFVVHTTSPILTVILATHGDRCWVRVTSDSQVIDASDLIPQGATRRWSARQSMTIVIGKVPAASVTVNGQLVPLPTVNQPLTVTFTHG